MSILRKTTRPVACLCVHILIVGNSRREEGGRASAVKGFISALMSHVSVLLVRSLNADVILPNETCPDSLVEERIGFLF